MCIHADGDFISNWTLVPGTRRSRSQRPYYDSNYDGSSIVASVAATCRSGIELEAVNVPELSTEFAVNYWDPILVDSDADASRGAYWYYYGGGGQDLKAANPYGFRAFWQS